MNSGQPKLSSRQNNNNTKSLVFKAISVSFFINIVIIIILGTSSNNYYFAKYSTVAIGFISVFLFPLLLINIVTQTRDRTWWKNILYKFPELLTLVSIIVALIELSSISSKKNKQSDLENKDTAPKILLITTLFLIFLVLFLQHFSNGHVKSFGMTILSIGIIICSIFVKKTITSQVSVIR